MAGLVTYVLLLSVIAAVFGTLLRSGNGGPNNG